jgi:nitrate reductase molybdenum cofactor assembly chaperone NarJ/NarW
MGRYVMNINAESKEAFHLPRAYQALARLLEYPQNKESLLQCLSAVNSQLDKTGMEATTAEFQRFLSDSTLPELQEDFVANFDFNPAKAPYLGHHLYGDNQKKASYMIMLKQEYERFGFQANRNELPDHLSVLLGFLAHLGLKNQEGYRKEFIAKVVLPGVSKMTGGTAERNQSPWLPVIEAAELLLRHDCKEASRC